MLGVLLLAGTLWGQAAVFNQYELEDGTLVTVQGEAPPPSTIEIPPSKEDLEAAEAAVQEQATVVRQLKEGQGLTNQVGCSHCFVLVYVHVRIWCSSD